MHIIFSLFLLVISTKCFAQSISLEYKKPSIEYKNITLPNGISFHDHFKIWYGKSFSESYWRKIQKEIGPVLPTNSTIEHTKTNRNGDKFFAIYKTNKLALREMPEISKNKKRHLILAGDSNTFGIGVNDDECSIAFIGNKHQDYQTYNFGHGGGGPNNTLALMELYPWSEHIKQNDGKMVYLFYYEWMMSRVIGSKYFFRDDFGGLNPWYELNAKNELCRLGVFNDRLITKFYKFINFIDRKNWIGELPRKSFDDNKLTAKIFLKMKSIYLKKFPHGQFTVALSLYNVFDKQYVYNLEQELKILNVNVVLVHEDLHNISKYHLLDWHFNKRGQEFIANSLMEKIPF